MTKKIKNFTEAKKRLLYITKKLESFWGSVEPQKIVPIAVALDVFVDVVSKAEALAETKEEKVLIKTIRTFFVPEEELSVLLVLIVLKENFVEGDFSSFDKNMVSILKRYTNPTSLKEREAELKKSLEKIKILLSL